MNSVRLFVAGLALAEAFIVAAFFAASRTLNAIVFDPGELVFSFASHSGFVRSSEGMHHFVTLLGSLFFWSLVFAFLCAVALTLHRRFVSSKVNRTAAG
jgi:hypothetical protein